MSLLDLFFPRRCVSCGKIGKYVCTKCYRKIKFADYQICPVCAGNAIDGATHPGCQRPRGLDGLYFSARYQGPVREAVHLLKYRLVTDLTKNIIDILFPQKPKYLPDFDCLIPVPLHPKRERQRGFNQSGLIAGILGRKWNVPVSSRILKRIRYTTPQVELKGKKRERNLRGAFACNKNMDLSKTIIGLVDDVSTTRSTLFECAKILKKQGARIVWGIVLAHG